MILRDEDRNILIAYRIEKAKEAIEDVQFLLDNDKLNLAINRIYYGMFYILTALALKNKSRLQNICNSSVGLIRIF